MTKVAIIGLGMAGATAAITLGEAHKNIKIDIYERNDTPFKKLLLTGNGRCNITNEYLDKSNYISSDEDKISNILERFDAGVERLYFKRLGLFTHNRNGYVYPASNQAVSVVNVLNNKLLELNANVITNSFLNHENLKRVDNKYVINGTKYDYVIMACGGMAGVYRENEFNGFKLMKSLGHTVNFCYPALVQTICDGLDYGIVTGVRCDCKISLFINNQLIDTEEGELQLTDKGLSGIPVFQLSRYIGKAIDKKHGDNLVELVVDFAPFETKDGLLQYYSKTIGKTFEQAFAGLINCKLLKGLLARIGFKLSDKCDGENIEQIIELIKCCHFNVKGLNNFKSAQISTGGIDLSEIDDNMESTICPSLFITGEMLDVSGKCGGYNLHFANATAYIAAKSIIKRI